MFNIKSNRRLPKTPPTVTYPECHNQCLRISTAYLLGREVAEIPKFSNEPKGHWWTNWLDWLQNEGYEIDGYIGCGKEFIDFIKNLPHDDNYIFFGYTGSDLPNDYHAVSGEICDIGYLILYDVAGYYKFRSDKDIDVIRIVRRGRVRRFLDWICKI